MRLVMENLLKEPRAEYAVTPPDTVVTDRIHMIRGQKVMLDRDLAELYGVSTKQLNQAVRRNPDRFPEDFMFRLTMEEAEASWSQTVTLKRGYNIKYLPFAFSEHGILMLANVLRSGQAIAISIHIIRVFNRMREVMLTHTELLKKLEQLEGRVTGYQNIALNFTSRALSSPNGGGVRRTEGAELVTRPETPRKSIGFKPYEA